MRMELWHLWLIALIPVIAGLGLRYWRPEKYSWQEFAGGSIGGLILAGVCQLIAAHGMVAATETWSGHVSLVSHTPKWTERWKVDDYETYYTYETRYHSASGSGSTRRAAYTTRERVSHRRKIGWHWAYNTHSPTWSCRTSLGQSFTMSQNGCDALAAKFGGYKSSLAGHANFFEGDPNVYGAAPSHNGWLQPVTCLKSYENRIQAAPSQFSFDKVPSNAPVFNYPANGNPWQSDRLIGTARQTISLLEFDQMNSRVGPSKQVNVIMIGFGPDSDYSWGKMQEAKWLRGSKNDLVLCYGGKDPLHPTWAYAFSWTERTALLRSLEALTREVSMDGSCLDGIENLVRDQWVRKDWHQFDKLKVEVPGWAWQTMILTILVTQGLWMLIAFKWLGDNRGS